MDRTPGNPAEAPSAGGAGEGRLARRAARVKAELERAGLLGEVSELGRVAFGLDCA